MMHKDKHDHHDHHDHDHTCDHDHDHDHDTCDHDHDHDHHHHHHHDHNHDHDHDASSRGPALWQAGLIAITGIMLLVKVASGTLPLYVHVRYTTLISGTGLVLLLLGLVQAWFVLNPSTEADAHDHHHDHDHDHGHSHEPLSWRSPAMLALLVPIVLGLLVPPKALSSAAIDTRGFGNTGTGIRTVETIASQEAQPQAIAVDRSQWTLLNWVNALIYEPDNPALQGKDIEVTGFVWRSEDLKENEFYVARFIVSCCTADGLAIYMPVISPDASELPMDSWVRVKGTVGLAEVMGEETAVIEGPEITPIEQPAQPYLYP